MKRVIILLLKWMFFIGVLFTFYGLRKASVWVEVLLILPALVILYILEVLFEALRDKWNVPPSLLDVIWVNLRRKKAVDEDKGLCQQEKERLKKSIDAEEQPMDLVSTLLFDSFVFILVVAGLVYRLGTCFKFW